MAFDRPSLKRSGEIRDSESSSSNAPERLKKLKRLRRDHSFHDPLGHRRDNEPSGMASDRTSRGDHEFQESMGSAGQTADVDVDRLSFQVLRRRRIERIINGNLLDQERAAWGQKLNELFVQPENPSQDVPEEMARQRKSEGLEKMKQALNILKPLTEKHKEHEGLKKLQGQFEGLLFQLRKEATIGAQKTYRQILNFIPKVQLPEDTWTQIQPLLDKAMEEFRALNGPSQQDHGEMEDSRYAEQGRTKHEAIERITQRFVEAASTLPPTGKKHRPPLGIRLTNDQYYQVRAHFGELHRGGKIPGNIRDKAREMAYSASDGGKVVRAINNVLKALKPLTEKHEEHEGLEQLQEQFNEFIFQLGKEATIGAQKTYHQILDFLPKVQLPEDTRTQIQPLLDKAMEKFWALNGPPQQDHGESDDPRYAEQGRIDPKAIKCITKKFLEAACRPKLSDGRHHPRLGISLTNDQYHKVRAYLGELCSNGTISDDIREKARDMAYEANDGVKLVKTINNVLKVLKPLTEKHEEHEGLKQLREQFEEILFQLRKESLIARQKTYHQILNFIPKVQLPENTRAQIQTPLDKAMEKFQALNDPAQQDHGEMEGSHYAEQGRTNHEAIERITQRFVEAVSLPPPAGKKRRPPLGIHLTDSQYYRVCDHLLELRKSGKISDDTRKRARELASNASDKGKETRSIINASAESRSARAAYNKTEESKAARAAYGRTEKGKEAQAKYDESEAGKSRHARYRLNKKLKESKIDESD